MTIALKFNLILLVVFAILGSVAGLASYHFLQQNARNEVLTQAQLMMQAAGAMRSYTDKQIKPLVGVRRTHEFHPQWVPAYAATQLFGYLRETHPEYTYKEATLNPTNLRDRAVDWEVDVVNAFRNSSDLQEFSGERPDVAGRSIFLAHPIVARPSCLECHSTPDAAPREMRKQYDSTSNGFGWRVNEIVGAQIVSVPASVSSRLADNALHALITALVCFSLVALIIVNIVLVFVVIRPLRRITATANQITQGKVDVADVPVHGRDEIAILTDAFNRMRHSLLDAMRNSKR